ncbi:MAG: AI-2E family transporter [Candidatus Eremiobacteraeota bacterium]|nr:AI-2E family transporter [Candidatus Eremiobacteraeota bacterium]
MSLNARLTIAIKILAIVVLAAIVLTGFLDFLGHVRTVATIIVGAIFLCYVIYPAVRGLNRQLPLWASILIVYAIVLAFIAAALGFIVPALTDNVKQLIHDGPYLVHKAQTALSDQHNPLIARLPEPVRDYIDKIPSQIAALLQQYGGSAATSVLGVVVSIVSILALFIVIPVVALYILLDVEAMRAAVIGSVPLGARPKLLTIVAQIDTVVGGFIRGQLLVAAIVGALVMIMLTILHVKYAILIGAIAGILEVIPYVGAIVGAVPAILIALFTNGLGNAIFVLIGFVVINQLEGHIISPFIVSESVGLSPLAVIVALLAGGELFGLPGLLLGVPVAGAIKVLLANFVPAQVPYVPEPPAPRLPRRLRIGRKRTR